MSAGDTVSFLLGVAGWVLIAVCLGNEQWKVSTLDGSVITTSTIYENLWKSCASDSTGVYNCRDFLSLFGLSDYVRASQALMIISIILGFFAAIVSLFGLQCIQFGTTDPVAKARMATAGGSLYILAALCALVPVSWYAFNITQQFYDPIYPGTKYELGPGLYIGWAGASLQLIGGIVLCLACRRTSGGTREYSYNYRAPRSMVGRVSKNYASEVDNSSNYGKNAYV
ncbi:claudin-15a isoform X3 [Hypanus sabinus]|uniref:claudin-15a isoform X3 n=1 Tax=Hypanus sabinus TaxID=79690 RepID=UPI0028C40ADC|nr:claudin-15a isoform X3 [Hypanus sabinus]XP_059850491.1 claudin-15a isoform X3 [Hypanus sabinus]